jgi:serine/threonine protein kinase
MHARGIVHRDLKPANVLLDGDRAKLADFGIASLLPDGDDSTISVGLTRTGAFMGTPLYMAPELDRGAKAATPASDMFALGTVAYELLSGSVPFAQPPVMARAQEKPRGLDGEMGVWIDRCLNFDPKARPSAAELASHLRLDG